MDPKQRRDLEYAYERLYGLYEKGDIRPAEMQYLQALDDALRPVWTQEQAEYEAQTQPTLQAREPSVRERVEDFFAPAMASLPGMTPRGGQSMARDLSTMMDFTPVVGGAMSLGQAGLDARAGDYGSAATNAALGLLDIVPTAAALRAGSKAPIPKGMSEGMIDVADQPIAREWFQRNLLEAQKSHGPIGKSVDVYTPDEYAGTLMGMTPEGTAGYAVKPTGEIASVLKKKGTDFKDFGVATMNRAEPQGGYWLNAFDTTLPGIYGRGGFRPVSRTPFSEDVARSDWGDEAAEAFMAANARYSGGRPDLVFMARNPAAPGPVMQGQGGLLTDYDDAVRLLNEELIRLGYRSAATP